MKEGVNYVRCPIDNHACTIQECIEYHGEKEQPCKSAVKYLARAIVDVSLLNVALNSYENPLEPKIEELTSALNINELFEETCRRLKVDRDQMLLASVTVAVRKLKKKFE